MNTPAYPNVTTSQSLYDWTQIMYALHALAIAIGILGIPTVIGSFFFGVPSLIAVVMNYIKRSDARATWLDSHFRWQIRTFWFGLLWASLCGLFVLITFGIGIIVAWLPLGIITVWIIYRIVRGWLALRDHKPMYA